jgi:5-methyltetrahydropteroyltriglutamate--homocysteine methyltransferase
MCATRSNCLRKATPGARSCFCRECTRDGYFLEYDTPRAGDFSPLRHLPKPKKAVLGLVSTKVPEIETVDALKRRIDEATKFIELERLCQSPQCGFASVPARAGRGFPMDLTERKLARVREAADQVWN